MHCGGRKVVLLADQPAGENSVAVDVRFDRFGVDSFFCYSVEKIIMKTEGYQYYRIRDDITLLIYI